MDIIKSPAGKTIRSPSGYTAFIPNPLPPNKRGRKRGRACIRHNSLSYS